MAQLKAAAWHSRQFATWQPVPTPLLRGMDTASVGAGVRRCVGRRVGLGVGDDSAESPVDSHTRSGSQVDFKATCHVKGGFLGDLLTCACGLWQHIQSLVCSQGSHSDVQPWEWQCSPTQPVPVSICVSR